MNSEDQKLAEAFEAWILTLGAAKSQVNVYLVHDCDSTEQTRYEIELSRAGRSVMFSNGTTAAEAICEMRERVNATISRRPGGDDES